MLQASWGRTAAMAGLAVISTTAPAYAYLDPGSASLILQAIVGAVGAGAVVTGLYWRKFTSLFTKRGGAAEEGEPHEASPSGRDRNTG